MADLETPGDILARDPLALVYEREYDITPDRLYALWTEREQLVTWFGPETVSSEVETWELQEGGRYALTMAGKYQLCGAFEVLDAPKRLVMTWRWADDEHSSRVDVRFESIADDRTKLTVIHSGFTSAEEKSNHDEGWTSTWKDLDRAVAG